MPTVTKTYRKGQSSIYYGWSTDSVQPLRIANPFYYPFRYTTSYNDTKTGINLPGWRSKIKNSQFATTAFSGTKIEARYLDIDTTTMWWTNLGPKFGVRTYRCVGTGADTLVAPDYSVLNPSTSTADNTALMRVYKDIRRAHQSFSGLTFLGELRQSIRMIRKPALALRQGLESYLDALKKRSRGIPFSDSGRNKRKKVLADTWLEFSFGWTPLLSDIGSAANTIARFKAEADGLIHRKSRAIGKGESQAAAVYATATYQNGPDLGFTPLIGSRRSVGTKSVRYIAYLDYTTAVNTGSAGRLAELSGFTLAEFIPTAWELIPWSFLVDYFSNVGDVLEAFATPTSNVIGINKTVRTSTVNEFHTRLDRAAMSSSSSFRGCKEGENGGGGWIIKTTTVDRTAIQPGNLALPKFQLENPFGANAIRRLLNMTSLASRQKSLKPFY